MLLDDWHDYFRLVIAAASLVCVYTLARRYKEHRDEFDARTLDYWFALLMWSCAAVVLAFEGITEDRPLEPRLIFYSMAVLVTLKALFSRGR